jgi:hypothetical protein
MLHKVENVEKGEFCLIWRQSMKNFWAHCWHINIEWVKSVCSTCGCCIGFQSFVPLPVTQGAHCVRTQRAALPRTAARSSSVCAMTTYFSCSKCWQDCARIGSIPRLYNGGGSTVKGIARLLRMLLQPDSTSKIYHGIFLLCLNSNQGLLIGCYAVEQKC